MQFSSSYHLWWLFNDKIWFVKCVTLHLFNDHYTVQINSRCIDQGHRVLLSSCIDRRLTIDWRLSALFMKEDNFFNMQQTDQRLILIFKQTMRKTLEQTLYIFDNIDSIDDPIVDTYYTLILLFAVQQISTTRRWLITSLEWIYTQMVWFCGYPGVNTTLTVSSISATSPSMIKRKTSIIQKLISYRQKFMSICICKSNIIL